MKVDIFDFNLPNNLIAEKSASPRDSSRMLLVSGSSLSDKCIGNLSDVFSAGDLFVINNTRVLSSRLRGKVNNYSVEVTFLNEVKKGIWRSLVKPAKRLSIGDSFFFNDYKIKVFKKEIRGEVLFEVNMDKTKFIELLLKKGEMPLPPYLKNNKMKNPFEDYQTIFAKKYGAVACPTAGLHFTPDLINILKDKGINVLEITLHVGSGTFLPLKGKDTKSHRMHEEFFEISKKTASAINYAKKSGRKIIAVGTTVLRALESSVDVNGDIKSKKGFTNIFITPEEKILTTDYLLTNFHLPKSTLFILVCAYAGVRIMHNAYVHAIRNKYRFYSLGDACLIKKNIANDTII